ncbi:MAG: hypothetical protein WDA21_05105 [Bacilli bacterium]
MIRVDFLGSPGVGKTSLYKELLRDKNKCFSSIDSIKRVLALDYLTKKSNLNYKEQLAKFILFSNYLFKPLEFKALNKVIHRASYDILFEDKTIIQEFLNTVLLGINFVEKDPLLNLMGIEWFFDTLKIAVLVEKNNLNKIALFDESLSQKVFGVTYLKNGYYEKQVEKYFLSLIPPKVLIHCDLHTEEIFNRIRKRKKIIPEHRNISEQELKEIIKIQRNVANVGSLILKDRGVKVVTLNMEDSIDININKIHGAIKTYFGGENCAECKYC